MLIQLGILAESSLFICNTYALVSFLLSSFLGQSKQKPENQEGDRKGWRGNWNDRRQKKCKTSTECCYCIIGQWIFVMTLNQCFRNLLAEEIRRVSSDYNKGYKLPGIYLCPLFFQEVCKMEIIIHFENIISERFYVYSSAIKIALQWSFKKMSHMPQVLSKW